MGSTYPTAAEAVATLEELDQGMARLFGRLPDEALGAPGTLGDWSAKDLMVHLAIWEELALEAIEDWRRRLDPKIHSRYAAAGDIDRLNEALMAEREPVSADEARAMAECTHERLIAAISSISHAEWEEAPYYDPPVQTRSLGELVGNILGSKRGPFTHADAHLEDLSRYLKSRPGAASLGAEAGD